MAPFNRLVIVCFLTMIASLPASEARQAEWIWAKRTDKHFDYTKTIAVHREVRVAKLKFAAEFASAEVWLNKHLIRHIRQPSNLLKADVTSLLVSGKNEFNVSAASSAGPAAIAFELEIEFADGTSTVASSSSQDVQNGCSYGSAVIEPWWNVARSPSVSVFDEYNQWQERVSADQEAASFQIADGFDVDLIYTAEPEHGSWVSMAVDSENRILLGKEDTGILRLTLPNSEGSPASIETIENSLLGIQGLWPTDDGLLVSASRSEGLFYLGKKDDNQYGPAKLLRKTAGGRGDHSRHDIVQDDQQNVYVIHGDSIKIPDNFSSLVPATNEFKNGKPEDGHVIQTDLEGKVWNVFASGLRNPYGLARNHEGEFFTYDADAERHTGLSYYRPTRIVHLMAGVDYGWRNPGIPWPGYLPDLFPAITKIGRGSPTSLKFGDRSNFPGAYRQALYALDWSYGRILAVHLIPNGGSYRAEPEVIVRGRPLSVCDLDFVNGDMYVITGGRNTTSRLYRIRYTGNSPADTPSSVQAADRIRYSNEIKQLRRNLESRFSKDDSENVAFAWQHLSHPDLAVRSAARILLEHQPLDRWRDRAFAEDRPEFALPALLAFVRKSPPAEFESVVEKLRSVPVGDSLSLQQAIRIESLVDQHLKTSQPRSEALRNHLERHFPTGDRTVDRELCRLLVRHRSENVVHKTLQILANESNQIDKFHYLECLANASHGWTYESHAAYFRLLKGARLFITDEGLDKHLQQLFDMAIEQVDPSKQPELKSMFAEKRSTTPYTPLPSITRWTVDEVQKQLATLTHPTDVKNGAILFKRVACDRCHRKGSVGRAFGPDLTTVANRFNRTHLLQQIIEPSKTISSQYQNHTIVLSTGKVVTGQVVYNGFRASKLRIATDPLQMEQTVEIKKPEIESVQPSMVSAMPERLLDGLTIQQIADLVAYLESSDR